jgi:hypothetical protein
MTNNAAMINLATILAIVCCLLPLTIRALQCYEGMGNNAARRSCDGDCFGLRKRLERQKKGSSKMMECLCKKVEISDK